MKKRRDMRDTRSASEAESLLNVAIDKHKAFQLGELDTEKWLPNLNKEVEKARSEISRLPLSEEKKLFVETKIQGLYHGAAGDVFMQATTRDLKDTRFKAVADLTAALSSTDEGVRTAGAGTFFKDSHVLYKPAEAQAILRTAFNAGRTARGKQAIAGEAALGFEAWKLTVSDARPGGDLTAAFDSIEASDLTSLQKQDAETDVRLRVQARRAEDQRNTDAVREKDLGAINNLIYFEQNYATAKIAVQNSSLPEADQGLLFREIERRAKAFADGIPIVNDRVEETRLFEQSLNIWKGTITKKEFDEDLRLNAHKLDDVAYRRIATSAATTLKSSQAQAISTAVSDVKNLIVDFVSEDALTRWLRERSEGMTPSAFSLLEVKTNEERHLQFWSVTQFAGDLRNWLAENPDKLGKEFYQYVAGRKHVYWNQSIADIRENRKRQEALLTREAPLMGPPAPGVPVITTQAEFDALPSGALFIDTDGTKVRKQ
ncbi:MAG TPA: hypothetical protein ENH94_06315 [Phycisphaerales bacterium]|nr:hypothetical protein [Phycisphaerales bacterium]